MKHAKPWTQRDQANFVVTSLLDIGDDNAVMICKVLNKNLVVSAKNTT